MACRASGTCNKQRNCSIYLWISTSGTQTFLSTTIRKLDKNSCVRAD